MLSSPRRYHIALAIVIALGVAARVGYAVALPDDYGGWRDTQHYVAIARSIVATGTYADSVGEWPHEPVYSDVGPTAFWLPGYPFLLAAVMVVAGDSPRAVFLLNALLGALTIVCTWRIGCLLFGQRVGLIGAALLSMNILQIYTVGTTSTEPLSTLLYASTTLALIHAERRIMLHEPVGLATIVALATGFALGILTRSNFVAVGLAAFVVLVIHARRDRARARSYWSVGIVATLVTLALVSPWFIRNHARWSEFIYQTKAGINLYAGWNDSATGGWAIEHVPHLDPARFDERERDSIYASSALAWIGDHPSESLALLTKKLAIFWSPVPATVEGPLKWILTVFSGGLLLLAFGGMICGTRRFADLSSLYLPTAFYMLSCIVAFSITRFRLPIDPALALFGAYGIEWIHRRANRRNDVGPLDPTGAAAADRRFRLRYPQSAIRDPQYEKPPAPDGAEGSDHTHPNVSR